MQLFDLEKYNPITIQCHDNPDADTLGSGYALYCYFQSKGKEVHLVYSGRERIAKANMKLMVEKLDIPIEYREPSALQPVHGLLITVDCQYGAGNVTRIEADNIAVIDHHPLENICSENIRIQPNLGACATLVWYMLCEADYPVNENVNLATALYYGLYMDTNHFSEIFNPLDSDMRERLIVNRSLLSLFRNSNISMRDLEIAGIAMLRYDYNDDYRFAVIRSQPCDPNILGLISDFLLQVDAIDTCVVFNESAEGFKFSVRSCIKEVKANELAAYLAQNMGSGGGHYKKAGGFISRKLYEEKFVTLYSEVYFNTRMREYFDSFEIIYAKDIQVKLDEMVTYRRKRAPLCYVKASDILKPGAQFAVRNKEGDRHFEIEGEVYFTMERDGTIHCMTKERFEKFHLATQEDMPADYCEKIEYIPTIKNWVDDSSHLFLEYAKICYPKEEFCIYAYELTHSVKIFQKWDDERYMLGKPGDYLAVSVDDLQDIFIEEGHNFQLNYEPIVMDRHRVGIKGRD